MKELLSPKEYEVLWELSDTEFLKPMFFGGLDGSHHSGTARRLAKRGFAEIGGYRSFQRRVNTYRRTPAGREAFLSVKEKVGHREMIERRNEERRSRHATPDTPQGEQ